ncbi:MAG: hypothetical protein JJV93_01735 [Alphaproteobacteria bacterium]|nr:hypothetical protein [Alphaproteobacteria bacterium]MBL0717968.1 hypothetical protein [Alphaproteobacteria bacterium]
MNFQEQYYIDKVDTNFKDKLVALATEKNQIILSHNLIYPKLQFKLSLFNDIKNKAIMITEDLDVESLAKLIYKLDTKNIDVIYIKVRGVKRIIEFINLMIDGEYYTAKVIPVWYKTEDFSQKDGFFLRDLILKSSINDWGIIAEPTEKTFEDCFSSAFWSFENRKNFYLFLSNNNQNKSTIKNPSLGIFDDKNYAPSKTARNNINDNLILPINILLKKLEVALDYKITDLKNRAIIKDNRQLKIIYTKIVL